MRSRLQEIVEEAGHIFLLYPKFHCELNWIEFYWDHCKYFARKHCNYTLAGTATPHPHCRGQPSRSAIEARSRASAEWIASHVGARRYSPSLGRGVRRQHLRSTRKELAGRYYQFLSGHAAIGSYLRDT